MDLRSDPASIAPERAIVFELAGSVADFYENARRVGLEYLAEDEIDLEADEDFQIRDKPGKHLVGRIYLAMPDVTALQELVRLWRRYASGQPMDRGFAIWRNLFDLLRDVRPWGPEDRILPETIEFWKGQLSATPDQAVRFEIELWFRENTRRREQALGTLAREVERLGGDMVHHAVLPEIRYDAALVDIPPEQIQTLIENPTVSLARVDDIMFLRPQAIASYPSTLEMDEDAELFEEPEVLAGRRAPIAALIDGVPIQNHTLLVNRLEVDDPDGLEATSPVGRKSTRHCDGLTYPPW